MNIYDLGVLSGHYTYNAYLYSFQQMMEYLPCAIIVPEVKDKSNKSRRNNI